MKKLSSVLLAACMLILQAGNAAASDNTYTTVKIPFPSNISDTDSWRTYAAYTDTKEVVTLSEFYDGYVWATVPTENKDRVLEAVVPEEAVFADIGEASDYFDMEWLSCSGVIKGNEKGEAEPMRNVTRAEAIAMVMRFMGLESSNTEYQAAFDDVSASDWFCPAVMSAYKRGITVGDSAAAFSPQRAVTREEFTAMAAKALKYAGLRCPSASEDKLADKDEISAWAKEAYDIIGAGCTYDYAEDEADPENPTGYLHPKMPATRLFCARLLNGIRGICQLYPSELAAEYGFDKEMPIIDGSTSTYPFTEAVYGRLFMNGRTHNAFPKKHSKTHTSYERLINGEVDLLFASHHPSADIAELAREKGVELELIPVAFDAMVFFTNADNPVSGLTKQQITDIYVNNAYNSWSEIGGSDALLYPYCRNNDSGSHAQMEKHFLNGNEIHPEVQKEASYTMENVLTDVMSAKTDNPLGYALGYSIYYFFNNMDYFYNTKTELKLLEIDGVAPNDETIASGEYPLSSNTYIVLRRDEPQGSPARKMAEFMLSAEGQQCVIDAGYGSLND